MITDNQKLVSAAGRFGHPIPTYDDGFGPLWIHRDSMGVSGIVRAQSFETAYGICEDEFFPEADETGEELRAEYNYTERHAKIIRPADGSPEREAVAEDYPLDVAQFVRWETIRIPAPDGEDVFWDNALFQDAFGFRPSGRNATDKIGHGIYAKDLNGDSLERLTPELVAALEITLGIESE